MAKSRTLKTPNADRDVKCRNRHLFLMGMQNGTATLEHSVPVSYKIKHMLTIKKMKEVG